MPTLRQHRLVGICWALMAVILLALAFPPAQLHAELSESQKQTLGQLRTKLEQAGAEYKRREFQAAGESIKATQESLSDLLTNISAVDRRRLKNVYRALEKAHALLELEGVSLPPLPKLDLRLPKSDTTAQRPNFSTVVAPILVAKCGRCHINDRKGGFSVASYVALMQGVPDAGVVVMPGNAQGSRIIEVIESGDMPRGGLQITADELRVIKQWIGAGAKFDGDNPSTSLARLAGSPQANRTVPRTGPVPVLAVTGKETVSFGGEIAPVLARECLGCHGTDRSENDLSFASFESLLAGGDSGAIIDRDTPDQSLLLAKLLGTGPGQRMPLNRPPLADAVINRFQTWLREGATFDGKSPKMALARVAAVYLAENSTHEELARERVRLAKRNWDLALPDKPPNLVETEDFLLVGSRAPGQLREIATRAEQQSAIIRKLLRDTGSVPFVKGRITVFVVDRAYDYLEFVKMVEQRPASNSSRAHWEYSLVDAYVVIVSRRDTQVSEAQLAEAIAAIYVSQLGSDVPQWFATGIGRAIAARIAPRDPVVSKWKTPVPTDKVKPADLLNGRVPAEIAGPVLFAFSKRILRNGRAFSRLTTGLKSGQAFDKTWESTYGASPQETLAALMR